jgi:hypothetical protein
MNMVCIGAAAAVASLLSASGSALAQDAMSAPAQKTIGGDNNKMVPSLAVLNSGGATLADGKLTMTSIGPSTIVFADRPVRAAGHVLTAEFVKQWGEGKDSFAEDPPNATVSVFNSDGQSIEDAVVVLKSPTLANGTLTFDVTVLEGDLTGANGPASLFIDWFAARGPYGGVAVGRAPVWRGGWYAHPAAAYGAGVVAGAAIGAAAASAYRPPCGYYPYPPCY